MRTPAAQVDRFEHQQTPQSPTDLYSTDRVLNPI
jgi:hypothetical protein